MIKFWRFLSYKPAFWPESAVTFTCLTHAFYMHLTNVIMSTISFSFFQFDLPFIKVFRVREWSFSVQTDTEGDTDPQSQPSPPPRESRAPTHSVWNCDGEIITSPNLNIRYAMIYHISKVCLFGVGGGDIILPLGTPVFCLLMFWGGGNNWQSLCVL